LLEQRSSAKFILVGGTGLYMQALCQGLDQLPPSNLEIREKLGKYYEGKKRELYLDALEADPGIEGKIKQGDTQRLLRILELKELGHEILDTWRCRIGGIGSIPSIWLDFPRDELYRRINERVVKMLKNGWIEEIVELSKIVPANVSAWQSLGYVELKNALEKNENPFSITENIAMRSRHYAKRQITWFRHKENPVYIDGKNAKSECNLKKIIEEFQVSNN
jgi:tRNA dimethylallyltransferase